MFKRSKIPSKKQLITWASADYKQQLYRLETIEIYLFTREEVDKLELIANEMPTSEFRKWLLGRL